MKLFSRKSRQALVLGLTAAPLLLFSAACSRGKSDAQIIGEVATHIQRDAQVPNKNVAIMSNQGVVTLNGTANTDAERLAASNDAAQVEGVKTVINNLTIATPATPPVTLSESKPVDTPLAAKLIETPPVRHTSKKPSPYHAKAESSVSEKASEKSTSAASTPANTPMSNTGIINTTPMPASTTTASTTTPAAHSDAILIPPPPLPVKMITIDSGTPLSVRLIDSVDSNRNQPGDTFRGTLDSPIYAEDRIAVPQGATVVGRIVEVKDAGRFSGRPQLALELTTLSVNNRQYPLRTNQYTQQGSSQGARTAKTVGGGAAIGALIGAIAGGGKGAAIGAAVGAAGGGGVQAARGPQSIHLGSEARLNFRLESPVSVSPTAAVDRGNSNSDITYSGINQPSSNGSYQDSYPSDNDSDRPVLKRRPAPNSSDSSNQPN
jgi:hypothetical protein